MNKYVNEQILMQYMQENHLTKKQFCAQCGISTSTFYRILRGANCKLPALFKIARTMHLPIHQILYAPPIKNSPHL